MADDELTQYSDIPAAAWNKLSQAANDPTELLRLMAVATVTPDGKPSNRTLVLRGADRELGLVWFHTDKRSPKMKHLARQPYVSAIGYDERAHLQIRLEGEITPHHDDAIASRHWEQASLAVRYTYSVPIGPGERLEQHDPRAQAMRAQHNHGEPERGRENFVVLELNVERIDWLQVGQHTQLRALLRRANNWRAEPLMP